MRSQDIDTGYSLPTFTAQTRNYDQYFTVCVTNLKRLEISGLNTVIFVSFAHRFRSRNHLPRGAVAAAAPVSSLPTIYYVFGREPTDSAASAGAAHSNPNASGSGTDSGSSATHDRSADANLNAGSVNGATIETIADDDAAAGAQVLAAQQLLRQRQQRSANADNSQAHSGESNHSSTDTNEAASAASASSSTASSSGHIRLPSAPQTALQRRFQVYAQAREFDAIVAFASRFAARCGFVFDDDVMMMMPTTCSELIFLPLLLLLHCLM